MNQTFTIVDQYQFTAVVFTPAITAEHDFAALAESVAALLRERTPHQVIIDIGALPLLNSPLLTLLLRLRRAAEQLGAAIYLAGVGRDVLTVLEVTHLDRVFTVFPSLAAAEAHVRRSA